MFLGPFPRRTTTELFREGTPYAHGRPAGRAMHVVLPPMPVGGAMLEYLPVAHEPPDYRWDSPGFESVMPWVCTFRNVLVHSGAGILCTGGAVVADTLLLTDGTQQHYSESPAGVTLRPRREVQHLRGRWLSLLSGCHDSYYHWTLDCLGRLAAADNAALHGLEGVLAPAFTQPFQAAGYASTGLMAPRQMAADALVQVDELVVPWTVTGYHRPHPAIRPFFERLAHVADEGGPRRIYIDRRGASNRQLLNEDAVIAALAPHGFVPVRLEALPLAAQIGLFQHAEAVVAPHGAGLANLVYARPGCRVLELHSDSWSCWCFRHLAAIFDLSYDCVFGRQAPGQAATGRNYRSWQVSPMHVLAAVQRML